MSDPGSSRPPWSPYPVQDWSQVAPPSGPVDPGWVSPDWAPPTGRRAAWVPGLVIALVLVLVAGFFYVADRTGRVPPASAASAYVPADGAVDHTLRETSQGTRTTSTRFVTESARSSGANGPQSVDFAFGTKLLGAIGLDRVQTSRFWRTTSTEIGSVTSSDQTVTMRRIDDAVELLGESGTTGARVYVPALVELPADVHGGQAWSSEGRAGDQLTYRSDFRAEESGPDCLRVTGTIAYHAVSGQQGSTVRSDRLWCRGSGPRTTVTTSGTTTVTDTPTASPTADAELRTETEPVGWGDPASWRPQAYTSISHDPTYGTGLMGGVPGAAAPVVTASGLLFRASNGDDVVAFTPKTTTEWTSLWRLHPGGRVLSLTAFGDVVVVTTSDRQVVGYTDGAVRLWQRDLADVAYRGPVRTSPTEAALVDISGRLQVLDVRTGEVRWQVETGSEVQSPPAASADAVVVLQGEGTVAAYESATGTRRWSTEIDSADHPAVVGDTLVVRNSATLEALRMSDGRHRWLRPIRGTLDDLQAFDGRVVAATRLGSIVISEAGAVVAERPPYAAVTVGPDALVGWGPTGAEVLDRSLRVVTTFETADVTLGTGAPVVLGFRQGVWRFGADWTLRSWSNEP